MMLQRTLFVVVLVSLASMPFAVALAATAHQDHSKLQATHGVASGDVTSNSAVIWSRTNGPAVMQVTIAGPDAKEIQRTVNVDADSDYTGKILFEGLRPDTHYRYFVWFSAEKRKRPDKGSAETGSFRTAPLPDRLDPVTFAWCGDLAGQNVCRDKKEGVSYLWCHQPLKS